MNKTTAATPEEDRESKPEKQYIIFPTNIGKSALRDDEYGRYVIDAVRSKKLERTNEHADRVLLHATDARQMAFVVGEGNIESDVIPRNLSKNGNQVQLVDGRFISDSREWELELEQPGENRFPPAKAVHDIVENISAELNSRTVISVDVWRLMQLAKSLCKYGRQVTLFIGDEEEAIGVMAADDDSPSGIGVLMPVSEWDEGEKEKNRARQLKTWGEVTELAKKHYG